MKNVNMKLYSLWLALFVQVSQGLSANTGNLHSKLTPGQAHINSMLAAMAPADNTQHSVTLQVVSSGHDHESRLKSMLAANPTTTRERCDACVSAEEAVIGNQSSWANALRDLSTAQSVLTSATTAHENCLSELNTASSANTVAKSAVETKISTTKATIASIELEYTNDDPDAGLLLAQATPCVGIDSKFQDWVIASRAYSNKTAECDSLASTKGGKEEIVAARNTTAREAHSSSLAANSTALAACAGMRAAAGYGAPTPAPTPAPTSAPTPSSLSLATVGNPHCATSPDADGVDMLTVPSGGGCTLTTTVDWTQVTTLNVSFDIRFCYGTCSSWTGPGDVKEHGYFEPFRNPAGGSGRETPDLWWISRSSDYGYGAYSGWSLGSGREEGTTHNPNDWHTWECVFTVLSSNIVLTSWTVDGTTGANTGAYQGMTTSMKGTTALGFATYGGTTLYVRNMHVTNALA